VVLEFTKMNGAGNDFILIDNRAQKVKLTRDQIVRLCDRHRGIGADGLMSLIPSSSGKADWAWDFYNSDGSTGDMCGNGARCFARFVQKLTGREGDFTFETGAGIIKASFKGGRVTVNLTPPKDLRLGDKSPFPPGPKQFTRSTRECRTRCYSCRTRIKLWSNNLAPKSAITRHFSPKGTNVNFVHVLGPSHIRVRTFERGVEGETLACGTGVSAAALISSRIHKFGSPVKVRSRTVTSLSQFEETNGEFADVRLTGPAEFVFEGRVDV